MALRTTILILLAAACIAIAGWLAYGKGYQNATLPHMISSVSFGTTAVSVEVASTESAREEGLSGRTNLAPDSGMLFVFDAPTQPAFWMKDMQFSLDMVFMDASGKVVTLDQGLSPGTYNADDPNKSQVFRPTEPVVYVLEVPAGYAAAHGIVVGSKAVFK